MKQDVKDTLPDAGYKILTLLDAMDLIAEKIGYYGEEYADDFFNSHDLKKFVEERWLDTKWEIENGKYKTEL